MATPLDRIRALPRRWLVAGGGTLVAMSLLITTAVSGGDDGRLSTSQPTESTASSADSVTTIEVTTAGTRVSGSTTTAPPTTVRPVTGDDGYELEVDTDAPAVEGRTVPDDPETDPAPIVTIAPPPWAWSTRVTEAGQVSTRVGCAPDTNAASLDQFLAERVGPVLGWDYQHVYPLGDDRYLWLFQDVFVDHSGIMNTLGSARFIHNGAMLQEGRCFTLLHRGSAAKPDSFEIGDGTVDLQNKWLWPMGGELADGELHVFWAEMVKDPYDPDPPDGLGWHPQRTYLARYDAQTLERTDYRPAQNSGVAPIYGYAVASDDTHTYLFGNTFEQNLLREGGFWNGPHSATKMYVARVRKGMLEDIPEYRTIDGWSPEPVDAVPIVERYFAENPMQPRFLDGQWVAATAVDGYWGDHLAIDVAPDAWGPWSMVLLSPLTPRGADPKKNTYHAQPLPWRDRFGSLQVTVSNNARNMRRDAWNHPERYRPMVTFAPLVATPPTTTPPTTTTTTTTLPVTTTTAPPPTTTVPPTTTTPPTTTSSTTTVAPTTTSSTTTVAPTMPTTTPTTTPTTEPSTTAPPASSTSTPTTAPVTGGSD